MRCNECNVDLGEEYTKCPLCGADTSNDEPKLKGIKTAEYPKYDKSLLDEKVEYHTTFPQKYVFRVCAIVSVVFGLVAYIGVLASVGIGSLLWEYGMPAVMTVSSLFYFFYAFKEKGRLLHSVLSLISTGVTLVLFTLIYSTLFGNIALAVNVILFAVLFICKPERVKQQLKATFKL